MSHIDGARRLRVVPSSVRPGAPNPLREASLVRCTAWATNQLGGSVPVVTTTNLDVEVTPATTRITCDDVPDYVVAGRDIDPAQAAGLIEMPFVPHADNAVDLGVELRDGGRVAGVAAEAKAAGLLPGDVIVAVDGIDVAGYEPHAIDALGFHAVPGHVVTWTIDRAGERRALSAIAPGAYAAPRYLRPSRF